ncbi:MAG: TIGR04283 family arsenosugar biosynthesis glycosyltransferase [Desulforhopalus sp.]
MNPLISIIIPTVNEEQTLPRTLAPLKFCGQCEVLVVDGGSNDGTLAIANTYGCRTISGPRGRARQMNRGVEESTGDVLLFLHADTLLPGNFFTQITRTLKISDVAAGAFSLSFDSRQRSLAIISWGANLRSRLFSLPYGDQGLFTSRKNFSAVGGFPEMEIMEDFVFIRKMRRFGRVITLQDQVITSARRWENIGVLKTTFINQLIIAGYRLGIPPATLARYYQRAQGVLKKKDTIIS